MYVDLKINQPNVSALMATWFILGIVSTIKVPISMAILSLIDLWAMSKEPWIQVSLLVVIENNFME